MQFPMPRSSARRGFALGAVLALAMLVSPGCDDGLTPPSEWPAVVADLAATTVTDSTVALTWTAPSTDGKQARATRYDIRYATSPLTEADWGRATAVASPPEPAPPGTPERLVLQGLQRWTLYSFAVRSADEGSEWSPLSNAASAVMERAPHNTRELIQKLKEAYRRRDYDLYASCFSRPEDGAPFLFFLNDPYPYDPDYWDLTEELRLHRRMFRPESPLPGESPVPQGIWLVSIDIQLTPQGDFSTERTDLYRSDANPTGLDPTRWRATDCTYTTYVFFKTQGWTDYLVNGRSNFVVGEDKTKQVGEDRKFLIYRWEDLGSYIASRVAASPSSWSWLKWLYR